MKMAPVYSKITLVDKERIYESFRKGRFFSIIYIIIIHLKFITFVTDKLWPGPKGTDLKTNVRVF